MMLLMELYLLRHGIADDYSPTGGDADRALTDEGKKKLRDVLAVARRSGLAPGLILSSPLLRAVETAEIAANELRHKDEVVRTRALMPEGEPEELWTEIRAYKNVEQLLLCGHQPSMGLVAGYLLGLRSLPVDFKKGGLMRIDLDRFGPQPYGVLKWYLVPRLARSD
jgi:phosphohistidine phosphatase